MPLKVTHLILAAINSKGKLTSSASLHFGKLILVCSGPKKSTSTSQLMTVWSGALLGIL